MSRVLIFFSFLLIYLLSSAKTPAQLMQQDDYILQFDSFTEEEKIFPSPTPKKDLPQQIQAMPSFNYSNYTTKSLGIGIMPSVIDFGIISPTEPVTRALSVYSLTQTGFLLYTYNNHSLLSENGDIIPDTSCDNGSCSKLVAGDWSSTLSFGLGYSCEAADCDNDFTGNRFRTLSDFPTSFAIINAQKDPRKLVVPLRLNTAATQPPGRYENSQIILAVPFL